jgi:hypothetical protein
MSEITREKVFDRAIDLVINQDHIAQQWTGRYIAVQSGLAIAAAALLSWNGLALGVLAAILAGLIAVMAIVLAVAITQIIKREYNWQKRYVEMVVRTEGDSPLLYQPRGTYKPILGKDILGTFTQIQPWIIGVWVVFIVFVTLVVFLRWTGRA